MYAEVKRAARLLFVTVTLLAAACTDSAVESAATDRSAPRVGDGDFVIETARYTASLRIPTTTNMAAAEDIRDYLQVKLDELVEMTADEPEPGYFETHQYELHSDWETAESDTLYTFIVRGYSYTGGAHPLPFVMTFTYAKDDDRRISLRDIVSGDESLEAIARQARLHFKEGDPDGLFADGLSADWQNWGRWFVSNARITFLFPVYQVAPYSEGEQSFSLLVESATQHLFNEDYFVPWEPPISVFDAQGHGPDPGSEEFIRAAAFQRVRTSEAYSQNGHSLQTSNVRRAGEDGGWLVDYAWQDKRDPGSLNTGTIRVTNERADFVATAFRVISPYSEGRPQSR